VQGRYANKSILTIAAVSESLDAHKMSTKCHVVRVASYRVQMQLRSFRVARAYTQSKPWYRYLVSHVKWRLALVRSWHT